MQSPRRINKRPWLAGVLSAIFPGTGQVYNDQIVKGILIYFMLIGSFVLMVIIRVPFIFNPAAFFLGGGIFDNGWRHEDYLFFRLSPFFWAILVFPILYIYAITDAIVSARAINEKATPPAPQPQNQAQPAMEATMNANTEQDNLRQQAQEKLGGGTASVAAAAIPRKKTKGLTGKFFIGFVLAAIGIVSVLDEMDIQLFTWYTWERVWPLIPLLLGLRLLKDYIRDHEQGQFILGIAFSAVGVIFLFENWRIFPLWDFITDYWQAALILAGVVLMAQDLVERRRRDRS
ncbi:MAG: hypothetical protein AB1656_14745 [Candidatus Omnitrophota bacterium]